jgi:hypothetical protein
MSPPLRRQNTARNVATETSVRASVPRHGRRDAAVFGLVQVCSLHTARFRDYSGQDRTRPLLDILRCQPNSPQSLSSST